MARRKPQAPADAGDELVRPLHLAKFFTGRGGDEYGVFWRERHQWLRELGSTPRLEQRLGDPAGVGTCARH